MPIVPIPKVANPAWMPDQWTPWLALDSLKPMPHGKDIGVYMIAIKTTAPPPALPADPLDAKIVDIGAAGIRGKGTSTLGGRVRAFRHVMRGKEASHGPARTCYAKYRQVPLSDFYVSFYPVWEHDKERSQCLAMLLERTFIYNWTVQHGNRPPCNQE